MKRRDVPMQIVLAGAAAVLVCVQIACSAPPVSWGEVAYPSAPPLGQPGPATPVATVAIPPDACSGSLRTSTARGALYGAWWRIRPDSSAVLMAGRSTDTGETWSIVAAADTTDRSRRGCDRPAPAIFADSASGYVDFAYFLEANEGAGVFFTHTMDATHMGSGEGVFHSPVAVLYGDRPSRVSVTAEGDDVAVAYEDPNAERPMIAVALSRSMGHIFSTRTNVSSTDLPALDPRVALSGSTITVQWSERPDSIESGGRIAVRRGQWK